MLPYQNYNNPYNFNFNQPPMAAVPQNAPIQADERIWVQNETSAEAYLVAPNGFVRLWDSNSSKFYEKKADASGRPYPMEVYEYRKISPIMASLDSECKVDYMAEIKALKERISALEKKGESNESNGNDATVE